MPATATADARTLTPDAYTRLRDDLATILEDARTRAREAVAREAVEAYWLVGKRIGRAQLTRRAGYGEAILRRLSTDLRIDLRTLQRAEAFHRAYPTAPPEGIGWSHVRELLKLPDEAARERLAGLVVREGLTRRQLAVAVRDYFDPDAPTPTPKLGPLTRPSEPTFLYRADVLTVVDGDTLDVRIDLGFGVDKRDRLRLAGIDAAALGTKKGDDAQRFVEDTLAKARAVVIQTRKFDLHGRYVAHVFYVRREPEGEKAEAIDAVFRKGRYLNQELLDEGLAVRWERAGLRGGLGGGAVVVAACAVKRLSVLLDTCLLCKQTSVDRCVPRAR